MWFEVWGAAQGAHVLPMFPRSTKGIHDSRHAPKSDVKLVRLTWSKRSIECTKKRRFEPKHTRIHG